MPSTRTERTIFIVNGSRCVFWRKEVPFGGLIDFLKKLGAWGPKNLKMFDLQCAQHERSNRFSSLMAQNACFDVRKCLLGVWLTFEKIGSVGVQKPQTFRLTMRWARTEQPIFIVNGSKCMFQRKEVRFVDLIDLKKFGWLGAQKSQHFRLTMRSARTEQPIFTDNSSKCVFRRKEVPFVRLIDFWKNLGRGVPKIPTFLPYNALSTNGATDFNR